MKNKKGFTLIELLAIIVILAIIAVITVPIILNIIENSKKGAATDSAYGYKDAIDKFYASKLTLDKNYNISDGIHTKQDFDNMGVTYSGKSPLDNSFLKTYKNRVIQGCLQFDEYKVEVVDGKPQQATKGECKAISIIYTDVDESGTINKGDTVKLEDEEFYVLNIPKDGKIKLLSKYNLNSSSRQASSGYLTEDFSDTYIQNYTDYLIELGAYFVVDGRRMKYSDAIEVGCTTTGNSCADFMANTTHRLENDSSNSGIWNVFANGKYLTQSNYSAGTRALIVITESTLVDEYTITFDTRGGTEVESRKIIPGNKLGELPTSTKTDFGLEGWYWDIDYTNKVNADTIPIGSGTLYAKWNMTKVSSYTDVDASGTISKGDTVKIYNDDFTILETPSNGKVKLLSKYNLNSSSRQASSGFVTGDFSDTYIQNYTNYLLGQGAEYITEGRRLKYTEAVSAGCNSACPDFVVNQSYRLENDSGNSGTWSTISNWKEITQSDYSGTGMRALIVINESAIPTN